MLLNLIKDQQPDIDKMYLYVKDPLESKYQLLINGREKVEIENLKNPKAFVDYSQTIDVHENLEYYNPTKKMRVLIVLDDMADMESNKELSHIVTELFLRGTTLNISQSYFKVPKTIRLNVKDRKTSTNSFKSFI